MSTEDDRYPYAYAADFVLDLAGPGGAQLSQEDACRIRQGIAQALGMDDAELARKLADRHKALEPFARTQKAVETFMRVGPPR